MATNPENASPRRGFSVSREAIATLAESERADFSPQLVELPRVSGPPLLFAIARDPRTIFTYWCIDWASIFEDTVPADRQVHLRVRRGDGEEESATPVEPMTGQHYLTVSRPGEGYRLEIGYYAPAGVWNSVAASGEVTMPPDSVAEREDVDVATIPFHLTFQRLVDLFRASNGDALAEIISRLQTRALSDDERDRLTSEEWEILRAMDLSIEDLQRAQEAFADRRSESALRRRAEALLGFGATSPGMAFAER